MNGDETRRAVEDWRAREGRRLARRRAIGLALKVVACVVLYLLACYACSVTMAALGLHPGQP